MFNATNTTKSLVAALAAVAALMAIPLAQASDGPPDAIDRFNNPAVVWDGPPDAIDRYRENQELATLLVTRPGWNGPPDAIDRYLGRTATASVVTVDDSFAWSEFGIGAGADARRRAAPRGYQPERTARASQRRRAQDLLIQLRRSMPERAGLGPARSSLRAPGLAGLRYADHRVARDKAASSSSPSPSVPGGRRGMTR